MTSGKDPREHLGLVQIYTGNGKGKTTASLGLALRAMGNGLKVAMVQFMKSDQHYGEYKMAKLLPDLTILPMGRSCLVYEGKAQKEDYEASEAALAKAKELLHSGEYDMIIMDEVIVTVHMGLLDLKSVVDLVKNRPPNIELVLTGRYAPQELIDLADLVTEMQMIKHPYEKGIPAREGIER